MTIEEEKQKLDQDAIIDLYRLDLTEFGQSKALFTPHVLPSGEPIQFGDEIFQSVAVEAEGFSWSGNGVKIAPKLRLARRNAALLSLLVEYDNLAGVPVERIVTYRRFLADGEEPDGTAILSYEIFVVDRVSRPVEKEIVFEMATPMDQARVRLPGRLILKNHCTFTYRAWNPQTEEFDYTNVFCPYTGSKYFDVNGNPVSESSLDQCSRQLSTGCEKRYPHPENIPFAGFPGVGRFRG